MADMMLPFPIKPATSSGASHYARYGVGGYYSVNSDSDRQSIPVSRLESGTLVYVVDSGKYWKYSGSTWTEQDFALSSDVSRSLENLQSTLNQKIEEADTQIQIDLGSEISEISQDLSQFKTDTTETLSNISNRIGDSVDNIGSTIETIQGDITQLQSQLENANTLFTWEEYE